MLGAIAAAGLLVAMSPMTRATLTSNATPTSTSTPPPPPSPSPIPVNATIGLDPTAGGPTVGITVTGQLFLPNESITLYWDDPSRPAPGGTAQADGNGTFHVVVKPFPGDQPGVHHLYASEPPKPHADFTLQGPPSPTPPASPTPSDSPSPSAPPSPTDSPSPSPSAVPVASISGIDIITRPPFVFLPIIGALGLLGVFAYWALTNNRRNRTSALPASVVHRSFRPDYGAPIVAPAQAPIAPPIAPAQIPTEPVPPVEAPAGEPPPPVEPQASTPPPPDWPAAPPPETAPPPLPPDLPGAPDAPPELPEPSD